MTNLELRGHGDEFRPWHCPRCGRKYYLPTPMEVPWVAEDCHPADQLVEGPPPVPTP